jgi:hypothetical protein
MRDSISAAALSSMKAADTPTVERRRSPALMKNEGLPLLCYRQDRLALFSYVRHPSETRSKGAESRAPGWDESLQYPFVGSLTRRCEKHKLFSIWSSFALQVKVPLK